VADDEGVAAGVDDDPRALAQSVESGPEENEPKTPVAEAHPVDAPALRENLRALAVEHRRSMPRVLYSWTTREQITAMAGDRKLLRRSRGESGEQSRFDAFLSEQGAKVPGPARALRGSACGRKRFAWSNPWATVRGFLGEDYGDQLLEIVLRPDSIIVVVDSGGPTWRYVTVGGEELTPRQAKAAKQRIAGALHISAPTDEQHWMGSFMAPAGWPLREFVLCNVAQVERWSYGTPAMLARQRDDAALMRGLATLMEGEPSVGNEWGYAVRLYEEVWGKPASGASLADDLGAATAWSSGVMPRTRVLVEVAEALETAVQAQVEEVAKVGVIVEPPLH